MFIDPNYLKRFDNKIPEGYVKVNMRPKLTTADLQPQIQTQTVQFMANRDERDNAAATIDAIERNTPDEYFGYPVVSIVVSGSQVDATYETSRESIEEVYLRLMNKGYPLKEIIAAALSDKVNPHTAAIVAEEIQQIASNLAGEQGRSIEFFFSEDLTGTLNVTKQAARWMDLFNQAKKAESVSAVEVLADRFFMPETESFNKMVEHWVKHVCGSDRSIVDGLIYDCESQKFVPLSEYFPRKKDPFKVLKVDFQLEDFMTDNIEVSFEGLTTPVKASYTGIDFSNPEQAAAMMREVVAQLQLQKPKQAEVDETAETISEYLRQGKTVYVAKIAPEDAKSTPLEVSFEDVRAYVLREALEVPHTMFMDMLNSPIGEYRPYCICGKCKA